MAKTILGVSYDGREIQEGDILTYSEYGIEYIKRIYPKSFDQCGWVVALKGVRVRARGMPGTVSSDNYVDCVLLEDPANWFAEAGDTGSGMWHCNFLTHAAEEVTQTRRLTVLRKAPDEDTAR